MLQTTLRIPVNEVFIFLTSSEHSIALPVKLIVHDNPDMERRSEMKGRANYNTGKTPDRIKECQWRKMTTGTQF